MQSYPYVITICSEKGGVGKTTLATNLAIFLKALQEDLPVTVLSFDNHFTIDKMFQISGNIANGTVKDLFLNGIVGSELLITGQYGVNYIPSCTSLTDQDFPTHNPMLLAKSLASSSIPGVVIIDTRPELNLFSENALFAADRVLVPVKDMASLENCRNIMALFDRKGFDRKSLSLLPCLIDSRIKFDGPFKDQKSLLRAYAINRGYQCMDAFISKSPKVESLNTNPDGKIYPILSHARGTEVFGQYQRLADFIISEFQETIEPRSFLFKRWLDDEKIRNEISHANRLSGISPQCPVCNQNSVINSTSRSYYYEVSSGSTYGFLEEYCYLAILENTIFQINKNNSAAQQILLATARESILAFQLIHNDNIPVIECHRFNLSGCKQSTSQIEFNNVGNKLINKDPNNIYRLIDLTINPNKKGFGNEILIVYPIKQTNPINFLNEGSYREFNQIKVYIFKQLKYNFFD